jgi:hypothetical protein
MLLRFLGAGAMALVFAFIAPDGTSPARAAGGPLVTGKCWCAIGWGKFMADCGSKHLTCTRPMCEAACNARLPKKSSAAQMEGLTDVSAARRRGGRVLRHPRRDDSVGGRRYAGHTIRASASPRSAIPLDAIGTDRDGRWGPLADAPQREAPRRIRARYASLGAAEPVYRHTVAGAAMGGTVAVEHSRPSDCYGIQWCGCWLRHALGIADRSLNLAINWARVGSAASPDSANVVVWRHHVGKLLAHDNGRILVQSGNDRGAVRTRWLSPRVLGGVVAWRRV